MAFGFGRIEFDGNFINLKRPWTSFQAPKPVSRNVNESRDGSEEINKFFSRPFINARLNLLSPQEKAELQRLFEYGEDGSTFTLIRDRNLGTYIPFEGGINPAAAPRGLKTNDDVDGTFTRTDVADSAWYLDEGTGLLTLRDGEDVPRFPEGKYGAGIQIDGQAINLIDQPSGPFNTNNWSSTLNMSLDPDTAETKDPANGNAADKLTATGTPGFTTNITGTAKGNEVAGAVWLKCSIGTVAARIVIGGSTSGTEEKLITVTTQWRRYVVQGDSTTWVGTIGFTIRIDTSGDILYAWGAGLYDSALFDLGTVGALSTSSITRNAEKLTFPSADIVNRDKGTILMWVKPSFDPTASGNASHMFYEGGDSAGGISDLHIRFFYRGASGDRLRLQVRRDNATINGIELTPGVATGLTQGNLNHIGFTWDATISDGGKIYVDGAKLGSSSTNDAFNVSETGDTFAIGSANDGTLQAFSIIDEVLILNNVLTANEIKGLFDLGIGLGVPRNRWTVRLADSTWNPQWLHSDVYDIPLLLKEVIT